jgi:hypothetical protein
VLNPFIAAFPGKYAVENPFITAFLPKNAVFNPSSTPFLPKNAVENRKWTAAQGMRTLTTNHAHADSRSLLLDF